MNLKHFFSGVNKYKSAIDSLALLVSINKYKLYLDCIWSFVRYGCVINHYIYGHFYQLRSYERKKAFTFRIWKRIIHKANDQSVIHFLKNKVDFNCLYADFLGRDWLYSKEMTIVQFKDFVNKHKEAIIKPMDGMEGDGISLCKFESDIESLFNTFKQKELLIEERIIQHPEMVFGNSSVNTIRVYTIFNERTGSVHLLKTVVRAGIGSSIVDNSHSGGCAYEIDKQKGYIISSSYCANGLVTYIHPQTDICMLGRKIPYWAEVLKLCDKAARKLPKCRLIGWDVAITKDGPILIEGNHMPDLDMIEFVGTHGYKNEILSNLNL